MSGKIGYLVGKIGLLPFELGLDFTFYVIVSLNLFNCHYHTHRSIDISITTKKKKKTHLSPFSKGITIILSTK